MDLLTGTPEPNGQWTDPNGNNINGMIDPATATSGSFTYFVSGNGICPDTTAVLDLFFDPCLGVEGWINSSAISWLGQNGAIHVFRFEGVREHDPVALFDPQGRILAVDVEWNGDRLEVDLRDAAPGVYLLHFGAQGPVITFAHR